MPHNDDMPNVIVNKGRHAGLPLQNNTYFVVVGANLRVRPRFTILVLDAAKDIPTPLI